MFSDHNAMIPEINCKKNTAKNTNMWQLNHILLNNQWITKIKEEIKKFLETNENKTIMDQNHGMQQKQF